MIKPKVIVMAGYGLNSEEETAYVFEKSGAEAEIVHVNDVIAGYKKLSDYQIMAIPGGFAYGDDTGSGNAYANKMRNNLWEQIHSFVTQDKLVIGICNGCQVLANLGLIPGFDGEYGKRQIAMMHNKTARYECRWVDLKVTSKKCVWTRGVDTLRCPVSHGEGNFYVEPDVMVKLNDGDQVAFRYIKPDGSLAGGEFPYNPNGAIEDMAAACDPTGRIMGIMPHPERNWNFYNQDNWTYIREKAEREGVALPEEGQGMIVFRKGIEYFE